MMHVADKILNVFMCRIHILCNLLVWEKICKNVSSRSKFSESFTESDKSVYSERSSESDSDSYHSDEYYENDISWDLSAAVGTQNQNNDDQWIQITDQASDIILTAIDVSPINTPGPVDCL